MDINGKPLHIGDLVSLNHLIRDDNVYCITKIVSGDACLATVDLNTPECQVRLIAMRNLQRAEPEDLL